MDGNEKFVLLGVWTPYFGANYIFYHEQTSYQFWRLVIKIIDVKSIFTFLAQHQIWEFSHDDENRVDINFLDVQDRPKLDMSKLWTAKY